MHLGVVFLFVFVVSLGEGSSHYPDGSYEVVELVPLQRNPRGMPLQRQQQQQREGEKKRPHHQPQPQQRYPPNHYPTDPFLPSASEKEPMTAETGHGGGHHDYVDYGAYTGGWGAFGWYSDHPVGGGGWGGR